MEERMIRIQIGIFPLVLTLGACAQSAPQFDLALLRSRYAARSSPIVATNGVQTGHAPSGDWVYEDGVRLCDGYFTRNPGEGHCAQQPPGDWRAFEFDGETYYIQQLTSSD
jgi:hypothetical protein